MSMKGHILSALREQLAAWKALLAGMSEAQLTQPLSGWDWSVKDNLAHLYAWQQRSIARLEAALNQREPVYPQWLPDLTPDTPGVNQKINAFLYETYRNWTWDEVYQSWCVGYLRLLSLGEVISERELLDSDRYAWLGGYSLADVLIGTYDHHQEHYDKLIVFTG